jgi:predicted helicase
MLASIGYLCRNLTAMLFNDILADYRKTSFSERHKGERFERLMRAYLLTDPMYAPKFKEVWLWNDFPGKKDLGGKDTGIDLVALTHEGDYWAIQCKCYDETTTIDKGAVNSFLATSSRTFLNESLQTVPFAYRLWISTTNKFGSNALEAFENQSPPCSRISLSQLQEAPVDWGKLQEGLTGRDSRTAERSLREHQQTAIDNAIEYFDKGISDRGKLIMACGTGKTFTSLKLAETLTDNKGLVLFLVPSIALLGQTLREWTAFSKHPINAICICSDAQINKGKKKDEDSGFESIVDLALPASTDMRNIIRQFKQIENYGHKGMTVVFSTYQSIQTIADVQAQLFIQEKAFSKFDLIICDEAHRTTGVIFEKESESAFTKVHDNDFIDATKRVYMTATPRLFNDTIKSTAKEKDILLCSMDDPAIYGKEIYRIGFGEAVEKGLLSDYKVLVLTVNENDIPTELRQVVDTNETVITEDDLNKLVGCMNALSKQLLHDEGILVSTDPEPMRRGVAFCSNIKNSKAIAEAFNQTSVIYRQSVDPDIREKLVLLETKHIDGTFAAPARDELLSWLKEETGPNECRVLNNVRCLSEGVDVPSLDAVMFLSSRNSQVDVVQSVGRVMRLSPGKKYGYIIIPIFVPANIAPEIALQDNDKYKVVWTVLNALRAHDDRFNAQINKIDLNKTSPGGIVIGAPGGTKKPSGGVGGAYSDPEKVAGLTEEPGATANSSGGGRTLSIDFPFEEVRDAIYARMVEKVGDRMYWENWAKDVADIAERQVARIQRLIAI